VQGRCVIAFGRFTLGVVEFGEPLSVGAQGLLVEHRFPVSLGPDQGRLGGGQIEHVHVHAGAGNEHGEVGQSLRVSEMRRVAGETQLPGLARPAQHGGGRCAV